MKRAQYAAFLGTHAWPASRELHEAIARGLVVADNNGRWAEIRSRTPRRFAVGEVLKANVPDDEIGELMRCLDVARRAS